VLIAEPNGPDFLMNEELWWRGYQLPGAPVPALKLNMRRGSVVHAIVSFLALPIGLILTCSFGGCATGPKWTHTPQANDAIIMDPAAVENGLGSSYGDSNVLIEKINGLTANFAASQMGLNWPFFGEGKHPLYLSPGKHQLVLNFYWSHEVDTQHVGKKTVHTDIDIDSAGKDLTVDASFSPGRKYRLTAWHVGEYFEVTLWDETNGHEKRQQVQMWTTSK
jgi:hypothetical protein